MTSLANVSTVFIAPSLAPLTLNPVFTWLGLREQLTTNDAPLVLIGFFLCVLFLVVLLCFHWLGQVVSRSSGCSLWEQWGGNVKRMIPLSGQKSMASTDTWLSWLSNNSNALSVLEHLTCLTKCLKHSKNNSVVIQPLGLLRPSVPGGAPVIIRS